jgi:hypothetical protein
VREKGRSCHERPRRGYRFLARLEPVAAARTTDSQLERVIDDRASFLPFLNVDARFDELRGEPRFHPVRARRNYPAVAA